MAIVAVTVSTHEKGKSIRWSESFFEGRDLFVRNAVKEDQLKFRCQIADGKWQMCTLNRMRADLM